MIFSREDAWTTKVSDFAFIEGMFHNLSEEEEFTFRLTNDRGEYIKCAGTMRRMMVEFTRNENGQSRRFILGVSKEDRSPTFLITPNHRIPLNQNEFLMIEDAVVCFEAFFAGRELPNAFNWRESDAPHKKNQQ